MFKLKLCLGLHRGCAQASWPAARWDVACVRAAGGGWESQPCLCVTPWPQQGTDTSAVMAFRNTSKNWLYACSGGQNWRKHFWAFFKKTSFLSRIGCILGICEVFYKNVLSGVVGQQLVCAPACCSPVGERGEGWKWEDSWIKSLNERRVRKRERSFWLSPAHRQTSAQPDPDPWLLPPDPLPPVFISEHVIQRGRSCWSLWMRCPGCPSQLLACPKLGRPSRRKRKPWHRDSALQPNLGILSSFSHWYQAPNGPLGGQWAPPSQSLYIWCLKPVPAPCAAAPAQGSWPFSWLYRQPSCDRK